MPPRKGAKRLRPDLRRGPGKDSRGRPGAGGRHEGRAPGGTPSRTPYRNKTAAASGPRRIRIGTPGSSSGVPRGAPEAHPFPDPPGDRRTTPPPRTRHPASPPPVTLHHPSFPINTCPPAVPGHSASIMTAIRRPPSSALVRIRRRFPTPSAGPIRASPSRPRPFKDPPSLRNCIPLRGLTGQESPRGIPALRHPEAVRSTKDALFLSDAGRLRGGSGAVFPSAAFHRVLDPQPSPSRAFPSPSFCRRPLSTPPPGVPDGGRGTRSRD